MVDIYGTSFLFSGITFNRKKLAHDFPRFQENEDTDCAAEKPDLIDNGGSVTVAADKKRKRKATSDPVDGFSVFKSSKSKAIDKVDASNVDNILMGEREYHWQLERDALFRKKHNIHVSGSNMPSPLQSFAELKSRHSCKSYLLRNLAELGFKELTPIQRQAIPVLLSGRECFACAPTGSGKTFPFLCPILMKLERASKDGIRGVILCPTLHVNWLLRQHENAKSWVQFAVRKRKLDLSKVEFLVLDEADKLVELSLVKQVDAVVKACSNPSILRSLFSATLPDTVEELARSEDGKLLALHQSFAESLNPPVLIFVQNKERAKELYNELRYDDIRADVMHADLPEVQRETAIDNFRSGKTWVLIATDAIARGMDFKGVNCVINYDFPDSMAAYIHRIGRSGRAGRSGEAITLYTEADVPYLRNIANVMAALGCEVPPWIKFLAKKKWRKHWPQRDSISTKLEE
ncbi:P-loop containing nucleoside triphosphate hydrolases superfamily protein [Perilla frutescens var. hirtella]|nr:P-loop containing nucleoside triphosphate hydrolases superfamily protein [Perilla frutescens var. hirtella]